MLRTHPLIAIAGQVLEWSTRLPDGFGSRPVCHPAPGVAVRIKAQATSGLALHGPPLATRSKSHSQGDQSR